MGCERVGDLRGAVGLSADADVQRLQPLDHDPGVERAHRPTGVLEVRLQRLADEGLRPQHDAAEAAALPVNMFRSGVDHHVSAEFQRALEDRRGEDVVDDDAGAGPVGDLANRL